VSLRRAALLLLAVVCFGVAAADWDEAARDKLRATAVKARAAVLTHPRLAPFEIEAEISDAIANAAKLPEGPGRYARARAALAPLETLGLGALDEIPSMKLHWFLGLIASNEDREEAHQHARYVGALIHALRGRNDGETPATAFRIVMIDDEYSFFDIALKIRPNPSQRIAREIDGRFYDVWTLPARTGEDRKMYFDATATQEAAARILKAREAGGTAKP
jgi:hypothetical protein